MGVNRFGQTGHSNLNMGMTSTPLKIEFERDIKIIDIKTGDHHNLMLSDNGELFANGDNSAGQINGNLEDFMYYHCTPQKVILPDKENIKRIFAKTNRSAVELENGKFYYWGGNSYHNSYSIANQPKYNGFNLFNEEPGMPSGSKIRDVALGLFHDCIITNIN
jgi:alpha-tubulin suppressor-like RCC1 family protein